MPVLTTRFKGIILNENYVVILYVILNQYDILWAQKGKISVDNFSYNYAEYGLMHSNRMQKQNKSN